MGRVLAYLKDHGVMLQENLKDHLRVSSDSDAWHLPPCPPAPAPPTPATDSAGVQVAERGVRRATRGGFVRAPPPRAAADTCASRNVVA